MWSRGAARPPVRSCSHFGLVVLVLCLCTVRRPCSETTPLLVTSAEARIDDKMFLKVVLVKVGMFAGVLDVSEGRGRV